MASRLIRALLLADDLALFAHSEEDLQALLDAWAVYCDRHHFETQVAKTEIVVFTFDGDNFRPAQGYAKEVVIKPTGGESCDIELFRAFTYKNRRVLVVPSFSYLGVMSHWQKSAVVAGEAREALGWKAFGSISASLESVPYLPFYRVLEVAESTVGGAFLHGGELWGAFTSSLPSSLPREKKKRRKRILKGRRKKEEKEKGSLSREFAGWLLGFGSRPCSERLIGWVELRDLAVQATARAVRALHDAQRHGGLLALAISQLHFNWESSRNSITWFGQLLQEIHDVWPRFKLSCTSGISWTGAPPADKVETLGRRFSTAVWQSRWLDRQLSVLSKKPKVSQQDFLLFHILPVGT